MLGILTYKDIPHLTSDDLLFCKELENRGVKYQIVDWNASLPAKNITHLLIRSPWDYFHKPEEFMEYLETCRSRKITVINDVELVRWNHTKHYMAELENAGVPVVPSLFYSQTESPLEFQDEVKKKWPLVVVKPAISGSAFLTYQLASGTKEFVVRCREILKHGDLMIQPYIESIQKDGEVSLIYFNNGEFSHAVLKRPKNEDFRVQVEHGGSTVFFEAPENLKALAKNTFKNVDHEWFYARVDIVDWQKNPVIGELEMLEPALYFQQHPPAAKRFAELLIEKFKL